VLAALAVASPALAAGPPRVDAGSYVVMNGKTGEVLAKRNAHARVPIASITKLMTVLVALEHVKLTDVVSVQALCGGRRRVVDRPACRGALDSARSREAA
jgi:D-alanyl-D-alanine carboxypeptidase